MNPTFKHYPQRPKSITPEFLQTEHQRILAALKLAESSQNQKAWFKEIDNWSSLGAYAIGEMSRVQYKFVGNMKDPEMTARDEYMRNQVRPMFQKLDHEISVQILESRFVESLDEYFGPRFRTLLKSRLEGIHPINEARRIEIGNLKSERSKRLANALIDFNGEPHTLTKLGQYQTSPDGALRKASFLAIREWFYNNRDFFTHTFDKMTKLRHESALALGHKDFVLLGNLGVDRTDYGATEVKAFREAVKKYVVPIQTKIHDEQARALGSPTLKPWDASYLPQYTLPQGCAPIDKQLNQAQRVFDDISPRLSAHLSMMREHELIDLENRPGKASGAFCTAFPDQPVAAIFCNSTGNADDVRTLMHEMGHAFQAWESLAKVKTPYLTWPSFDLAEVHSFGMEYISLNHMQHFFAPAEITKFTQERFIHSISLITYCCAVDEYQHWVYTHPDASINERDQAWVKLWNDYKPSIDFTGYEHLIPTRWYQQNHIFDSPFYYIDYAIAEMCAMQLGDLYVKDRTKGLNTYLDLCMLGGTLGTPAAIARAGLKSPFNESTVESTAQFAALKLGIA